MATDWSAVRDTAKGRLMQVQANPTQVTYFDPNDADKLCAKIEKIYKDLQPDLTAVENAGATSKGGPIKLVAYKRPANKAENVKASNVALYGTGKAVWTNLAPVVL